MSVYNYFGIHRIVFPLQAVTFILLSDMSKLYFLHRDENGSDTVSTKTDSNHRHSIAKHLFIFFVMLFDSWLKQ